MRTRLRMDDLWDTMFNRFEEPTNQEAYEAIIQGQKDNLIENKKNDVATLFLIQQGLDESISPKIAAVIRSKEAWDILEMECNERERNIDQHRAKSQSVAVVGEFVGDPVEAEEDKQDIEIAVVEEFARDAEENHGKESESHYVDTHVDDEIEFEDENEISFATVEKCEKNLALEDINENTVNIEFHVELTFIEEWIANPKYESEYGKDVTISSKEGTKKMKETIGGVEVIVTLEEEMKENEYVIDLTKFDISSQLVVVEVQKEVDEQGKEYEEILKKMTRVMLHNIKLRTKRRKNL